MRSQIGLKAKNMVSSVIWHPKTVKVARSSWNYLCDAAQYFKGSPINALKDRLRSIFNFTIFQKNLLRLFQIAPHALP